MKIQFIKNSKRAIKTWLFWCALVFTTLVFLAQIVGYIKDQIFDFEHFIISLGAALIGFPFGLLFILFCRWLFDFLMKKRNYNSFPFNELQSIGFQKELKNTNSKWEFVELYQRGSIDGFIVDCVLDTTKYYKFLHFKFYVKHRYIDSEEFYRLEEIFKEMNGFFDFYTINKKYHYKKHHLNSIADLNNELEEFAKILKQENFEPDLIQF
ncbi:MAG: hypothetical protein JEZ09_18035 [Salinivirgaceae bacterium]|nr:hypothetical protein [Salinivirgaceae bacterium]